MPRDDSPSAAADRAAALVLGAALRSVEAMSDCAPMLRASDFRSGPDGMIWDACLALHQAGKPVDPASVFDELLRRGTLADAGGAARLAELAEHGYAAAAVTYHAGVLRDHAILRGLAIAAEEMVYRARHPDGPAREILADAERRIFALADVGVSGQARPLSDVLADAIHAIGARMEAYRAGVSVAGVPSGLDPLDNLTGGFRPGQLVILAARPSVGKTAVAAAFASRAADAGRKVLFCSLEQSACELAERMLSAASRVQLWHLRDGSLPDQDWECVQDARDRLHPLALSIDDAPSQSVLRVASAARRLASRGGLDLLVIDYLQLLEPEDREAPQHEQIAANSMRLKALARELALPVLALAQLNREVEGRGDGRPRLSDLRGSGQIEQDADVVILLHRPRDRQGTLEFILAKQRNGPTGDVAADFDRERMTFTPTARTPFDGH